MMARQPFPVREKGYVNPDAATGTGVGFYGVNFDADEQNSALQWPESLRVYDQMYRNDSQVSGVLRAVTLPIRRTTYRLDPQGASPDVVRLVAEDLGLPVKGGNPDEFPQRARSTFSWADHLRMALLELRYGHMIFERVYEVVDGQARLKVLSPRMPRTVASINVAQDGSLVSVEQLAPSGMTGTSATVLIPAARLVVYVNELEGANWLGASLLRPAYKHWIIKDRLMRVQAQTIERNGMGIPVYTAAEDESDLAGGLKIASSVRAGDNSGTSIPNGSQFELKGVSGTLPNAMDPINYHDQQIARAMLAHFLNLGTQTSSATGSYNLGSTFSDFFTMSLQTIADHICDVATRQVVADMVAVNFGPDAAVPRVVCDDIGSQMDATAQAILYLSQAGMLSADDQTEAYIRLRFGLPMADPSSRPAEPAEPADA